MSSVADTVFGNRSLSQFDVLIIGSGPSGSAAASMLCALGQRVLILERGPNYYDGLDDPSPGMPVTRLSSDELKRIRGAGAPSPLTAPRSYRPSVAAGKRTQVGSILDLPQTVGGGGAVSNLRLPRFEPTDFQLGTLLMGKVTGSSYADWPISYDDLEPFYLRAEQDIGVQGLAGADPNAGARSGPFPMAPGVAKYSSTLLKQGAEKLGYQAFPFPCGVNSRPYDGRPACVSCGFCSGFGCPTNAKGSPPFTSLRKALLSGNCQLHSETRVTKLLLSGASTEVTGVQVIQADGSSATFQADRYMLAAGPIEDARLVLLSSPSGVGNSNGMVGRNFLGRYVTLAIGIFEDRVHNDRGHGSNFAISDFRGVPGDPSRPIGGLLSLGGEENPLEEAGYYMGPLKVKAGAMLKDVMRQSPGRDRLVYITMYGEDPPQSTNTVDLDPDVRDFDGVPVARITFSNHPLAAMTSAFYAPKILDILGSAGARYGAIAPYDPIGSQVGHYGGTLRFGADSTASVCDATGRFYEVGNLYGVGGSLFPTLPGFNPTLTMEALSLRVAAGMVFPGSPEKGLEASSS